jgi:ABC-type phosphate/phosphonate transport system substrate-binding protein
MRKSTVTATFASDIQTVWNVVTNNEDFAWRSDLSRITIQDKGNTFTEYTKNGYKTEFIITTKQPYSRYEFDMKNKNFSGHWTGIFSQSENNGTKIVFSEELIINNPILKLISYLFMNLKKMQEVYIADLMRKLGE